jgi:cobalt-zinc-cadmium efflux system protein
VIWCSQKELVKERAVANLSRVWLYVIIAIVAMITFGIELKGNIITSSLGLLSDAVHLVADLIPVFLGIAAVRATDRGEDSHHYERRVTLTNIWLLIASGIWIVWQTLERALAPEIIAPIMIWYALPAAVGNIIQAYLVHQIKHEEAHTNEGQLLHFSIDAGGSIVVLIAGILILSGWSSVCDTVASGVVAGCSFLAAYVLWRRLNKTGSHHH